MRIQHLVAAVLIALQAPAFAIGVNISGFSNGDADEVVTSGTQNYSGVAGEFVGSFVSDDSVSALRVSTNALSVGSSFTAYCAELTQSFYFGTTYQYALVSGASYFSAQKTADLSRLFTAANGLVVDAVTSAAMQAAIWEVIYETDSTYDLGQGAFKVVPEDPQDTASFAAFSRFNGILGRLSSFNASYSINVLANNTQQDFVIATIPEPQTWALLVAGLGALGVMGQSSSARRRQGAKVTSPK